MRLLRVEGEDAVREAGVIGKQGGDRAQPQLLRRGQTMTTIRRPESLATWDRDHRIEEETGSADRVGEALRVRSREIALERGSVHGPERQGCEHEGQAGVRIAVRPEHRALRLLDL